jgi:hypothetical protein
MLSIISTTVAADPVSDYCAALKDRIHFCMQAFFDGHRTDDRINQCEAAPAAIRDKYDAAIAALSADSAQAHVVAESYFALTLDTVSFPQVRKDFVATEEELTRLPPIVHEACD